MMKGIWFNEIHSYEYLNLILSKTNIPPAAVKTNFIDIPGGDGSVDLTEAQGEVKYKDRECTFTFTVLPTDDFEEKKREVSNLLNGKRCKITLDKDPDYYWNGRCYVNEYASNKKLHQIVIGATVAPYKLKQEPTRVIIPEGENVIGRLWNSRKTVIPTVEMVSVVATNFTVIINGNNYTIYPGQPIKIFDLALKEGYNEIKVTADSPLLFTYQEGDL